MAAATLNGDPEDISLGNATLRLQRLTSVADTNTYDSGFRRALAAIPIIESNTDTDVQVTSLAGGTLTFGVETGTPNLLVLTIGQ